MLPSKQTDLPKLATGKPATPARKRADWEAVERDYRTGRFTLRELEAKHGAGYADISRRAKREGWQKDLASVIRQATNAALLSDATTKAQSDATTVVLVAAELNKQVILGHRSELGEARVVAMDLLAELRGAALLATDAELLAQILAGAGADPRDEAEARKAVQKALGITSRVTSIKGLAETLTKLHAGERVAHGLDDEEKPGDSTEPPASVVGDPAAYYAWFVKQGAAK